MKLNIGSHLSISKGYAHAAKTAVKINSNTFQYFSRNPRGGSVKAFNESDVEEFKTIVKENNFAPILCHAPYTYNLCSSNPNTRDFAKRSIKQDLERLELLPCKLFNLHPGSHTGQGVEKGIELIVEILNDVIIKDMTSYILLESMSGKGTELGSTFSELKEIIDRVNYDEKMGICLDTCHVFSAGYDIVNNLENVIEEFDDIIGLDRLKAVHLNDSMNPFGSKKDRHAGIGEGEIGLEALINFITHPKLNHLPFFLETPYEVEGHKKEIEMIKEIIGENND